MLSDLLVHLDCHRRLVLVVPRIGSFPTCPRIVQDHLHLCQPTQKKEKKGEPDVKIFSDYVSINHLGIAKTNDNVSANWVSYNLPEVQKTVEVHTESCVTLTITVTQSNPISQRRDDSSGLVQCALTNLSKKW